MFASNKSHSADSSTSLKGGSFNKRVGATRWGDGVCPKGREDNNYMDILWDNMIYVGFVKLPDLDTSFSSVRMIFLLLVAVTHEDNQLGWRSSPMIQDFTHHRCWRISEINSMMFCCTAWAISSYKYNQGPHGYQDYPLVPLFSERSHEIGHLSNHFRVG